MKTLGERIKEEREARGWSQQELADLAGVSQGTIGNLESGFRKTARNLVGIAMALEVRPEYLATGKGEKTAAAQPRAQVDEPQPSEPPAENLVDVIKQLAELLQAASPMARKAAEPVLAGLAESPETWLEAADMLTKLVGTKPTRERNPQTSEGVSPQTVETITPTGGHEWKRKAGAKPQEAHKAQSRRRA